MVRFNANGGSVAQNSLNAARTISYTFKNWNTEANGSGTSYSAGASYTADEAVTLYAQWYAHTTTATVSLPVPTRNGYTFQGWAVSSAASSGVTGSYTPDSNVTLYAIWKAPTPDFILPSGLKTIEQEAFEGAAFTYAVISNQVSTIGSRAFADCTRLSHIYIPESTVSIATDAFFGVNNLIIHGVDGSYAEFFATKYGFEFIPE